MENLPRSGRDIYACCPRMFSNSLGGREEATEVNKSTKTCLEMLSSTMCCHYSVKVYDMLPRT
jgi:hypothetical protein